MNFKNGKRRIGLIALLSCVLTATVAFAAYTGYNYIQGTVEIVGNPFKMVFATSIGDALETGAEISGTVGGAAQEVAPMTVGAYNTEDRWQTLQGGIVSFEKVNDSISYTVDVMNAGGTPAYLQEIEIGDWDMPVNGSQEAVTGLKVSVEIVTSSSGTTGDSVVAENGFGNSLSYENIVVGVDEVIQFKIVVTATDAKLFSVDMDVNGDDSTLIPVSTSLGQIRFVWGTTNAE